MLTQLSTLKSRLGLAEIDLTYDDLLTRAIQAVSARFDRECDRTLARTVDFIQEFPADETEIVLACYPVERVTRFELKSSEASGWTEQSGVNYLLRGSCVLSLAAALGRAFSGPVLARVVYTGGYVLPGGAAEPGQIALPPDLETAAVEQAAFWFQNRERVGHTRIWEYHATYRQFGDLDLLPNIRAALAQHRRWKV